MRSPAVRVAMLMVLQSRHWHAVYPPRTFPPPEYSETEHGLRCSPYLLMSHLSSSQCFVWTFGRNQSAYIGTMFTTSAKYGVAYAAPSMRCIVDCVVSTTIPWFDERILTGTIVMNAVMWGGVLMRIICTAYCTASGDKKSLELSEAHHF